MIRKIVFALCFFTSCQGLFAQEFIQRQGKKLYYQGDEIYLRGMAFGNLVWDDAQNPANHHSEIDFIRLKDLGMNAIRFYLNYKTFESDAQPYQYKASGWNWIDQNIQWAKNNGIFLILNMHVPQGGYQSQCDGDALWTDVSNQERLAGLWKAIAARYKDEPQIAGYDILNEPTPSGTTQNWTNLAKRIIDSIRTVDQNHLIITERALALNCDYGYNDANNNYPQITETNLMYTVHLYDPYEFTHQNLSWAGTGDGGKYPDNDKVTAPGDATYATGDYNNPSVVTGTSDWQYYTGSPFSFAGDSIIIGRIVYLSNNLRTGKVYYDDLELKELDAGGNVIRTILKINPASGSYWWWSSDGTGAYTEETSGHNDNYSVSVSGNTSSATVICSEYTFKAEKGKQYVVSGWMKGENIPSGASASISTEFYYSPSGAKPQARNYEYLKERVIWYAKYVEDKGFPVYFGEFGAARTTFVDNKGGAQWVADAMHLFDSLGYHFTYHSYKESSFGYYDGWNQPVDPATVNTELTEVFRDFFGTATSVIKGQGSRENNMKMFPNPASEYTTVTLAGNQTITNVEISDMLGNLISASDNAWLDLKDLPAGTYIVKVKYREGVSCSKLIKY